MLLKFFDINKIIHYKDLSTGHTVNQANYIEVQEKATKKLDKNNSNFPSVTQ